MKLRKIGVRFTLQQSYGFEGVSLDLDGKEEQSVINKFPVYVQVTYQRKNTKFKIGDYEFTKDEFLSNKTRNSLEKVESKIKSVIELETSSLGDKFSLKGLGARFEKYDEPVYAGVFEAVLLLLKERLKLLLNNKNLNGKELFFCNSLIGFPWRYTDVEGEEKKHLLSESLNNIEQIGNMLLDRNHLNIFFTDNVKEVLNTFINIFDNKHDSISIYNWLQDSLNNKQNNYTNKVNELLWMYLKE